MTSPTPETIDRTHLAKQLHDTLTVDWNRVDSVWLTGSFANPDKPIDRPNEPRSDIDIDLIFTDYDAVETLDYDGRNPAILTLKTTDGSRYPERTLDIISGCDELLEDRLPRLKLPHPVTLDSL